MSTRGHTRPAEAHGATRARRRGPSPTDRRPGQETQTREQQCPGRGDTERLFRKEMVSSGKRRGLAKRDFTSSERQEMTSQPENNRTNSWEEKEEEYGSSCKPKVVATINNSIKGLEELVEESRSIEGQGETSGTRRRAGTREIQDCEDTRRCDVTRGVTSPGGMSTSHAGCSHSPGQLGSWDPSLTEEAVPGGSAARPCPFSTFPGLLPTLPLPRPRPESLRVHLVLPAPTHRQ